VGSARVQCGRYRIERVFEGFSSGVGRRKAEGPGGSGFQLGPTSRPASALPVHRATEGDSAAQRSAERNDRVGRVERVSRDVVREMLCDGAAEGLVQCFSLTHRFSTSHRSPASQ
jgi:hypothetical protein